MQARATITTLVLTLLSTAAPAVAQDAAENQLRRGTGTLLGRIVAAETMEPLAGTSVEVWLVADTTRIGETVANEDGRFRIGELPEGEYYLRLVRLGYASHTTEQFELAYGETRDLGTLPLPIEALELEPITVSAERTAVTFEADRTSYNLGVMGGTEGTSVTDALRQIPELEIGIDGEITIRGNRPIIYIDGRPAPMTAEALALFLEQFPAEYLAKVEVMEAPSARYSAEGSGGIVNLVLKEGVELGLSGSIHANAGTRGQYGAGARATLQRGDWTFNGNGMVRLSDVERTSFDLRQNLLTDPAFLQQDAWSQRSGLSGSFDLSTRYQPSERMEISVRGRVSPSGGDSDGLTTTTHMDDDQSPFLRYDRAALSDSRGLSTDVSGGFEYQWEPREHELEVEFSVEHGSDIEESREEITSEELIEEGVLIPAELTIDDSEDRDRELSFEVDYTRPWGGEDADGEIEAGFHLSVEDSDSDRLIHLIDDPETTPEGMVTDRGYDHRETVRSAYLTVDREFGELGVEVGLRAEHTESELGIPTGESFTNDYLHLFPSANLSYRFDRSHQLRFSYSRRVERPSASVLNPIDRSTDPLTRRVGNPDVEPQFTHTFSLNANRSSETGNIRLSAYYHRTTNDWAETVTVDDDGVSTRTWHNIASRQAYGLSASYFLRRSETWRGMISVSGGRSIRDASNLSDRYSGSYLRWSSRANLDARISDALSAEGSFTYTPPTDFPQGRSDANYTADFGMRYRFLEDRASVRLSLRDPFELRRDGVRMQDVSYIQIGRSRETTRSATITLSYTFGGEGRWRGGRGRDRR